MSISNVKRELAPTLLPASDTRQSLPLVRPVTLAYGLSILVAALLVVTSVAGLFFGQQGLYDPDPATLAALVGQDALTLLIGVPLLLGSAWLAHRGSLRGLLLWMGALFYMAYSYAFHVLGPVFNPLYLAYIVIVSASLYGFLYLLVSTDAQAVRARFSERTPTRLVGGFLAAMALLMGVVWVGALVTALAAGAPPAGVERLVWPMDLVIAFPAMFWGGIWLWRRQALGYLIAGVLLVKVAFLGLGLVAMTWLGTLWGVPADPGLTVVFGLVGGGGLVLTMLFLGRASDNTRAPGNTTVPHPYPLAGPRQATSFGERLIGALLVLTGLGIFAIWAGYLTGGAFGQVPQGLFAYQDGNYPIFHLVAEGLMGTAALFAGVGLWQRKRWGRGLGLLALGMLGYSAINSSGWPLQNDPALLVPMAATLVLVIGAFPHLLRRVGAVERKAAESEDTRP